MSSGSFRPPQRRIAIFHVSNWAKYRSISCMGNESTCELWEGDTCMGNESTCELWEGDTCMGNELTCELWEGDTCMGNELTCELWEGDTCYSLFMKSYDQGIMV